MRSSDEKELLGRFAAGDDRAFSQIYHRYNDVIFSAAMLYVKDSHSAHDVVQQVFVKIWEKRARMADVESFEGYVVVISRNLILDQFRRRSVEARKIAELAERRRDSIVSNTSALAEDNEYTRLLQAAVNGLPPQQKKIYLLTHEEDLSYQRTAAILGLSKFTVKRHLELARRYVRNYVTQYLED
jgi:RNA polymerase sigma-70 factor (family 1)